MLKVRAFGENACVQFETSSVRCWYRDDNDDLPLHVTTPLVNNSRLVVGLEMGATTFIISRKKEPKSLNLKDC